MLDPLIGVSESQNSAGLNYTFPMNIYGTDLQSRANYSLLKHQAKLMQHLDQVSIDRVIQMAWEDRTSFDAIHAQFGLTEAAVIRLMRSEMKSSSFRMWRARVSGRKTKHQALRSKEVMRFKSSDQKNRGF